MTDCTSHSSWQLAQYCDAIVLGNAAKLAQARLQAFSTGVALRSIHRLHMDWLLFVSWLH